MLKLSHCGKYPITHSAAFGTAVLFVLLLLITSAPGQDRPRQDVGARPPSSEIRTGVPDWPGELSLFPGSGSRSSVVEIKSSFTGLRDNLSLLTIINHELQGSVSSPSWPDYAMVLADVTDIRRLAIRLMRNLALTRGESNPPAETSKPAISADELKAGILLLDANVQAFLGDPVLNRSGTVDVNQLGHIGSNLAALANRSAELREDAERLAMNAGKARGGKATASQKSAWSG